MKPQQPTITIHMPPDLMRQFLCLAEAEHRSPNNQILFLLRNSIAYHERTHGRFPRAALDAVDLSPYLPPEGSESGAGE